MRARFRFASCLLLALVTTPAYSASIPSPKNPWRGEPRDDQFHLLMSEFPEAGSLPLEPMERSNRIASRLVGLANDGDLRARLVFLGGFSNSNSFDKQVIELFDVLDNSQDASLLYDVAKIMQLRQSLCLTVSEEDTASRVERRCSASYDDAETERLTSQFNGRYIDYFLRSAELGKPEAKYELALILLRKPSEIPFNKNNSTTTLGGKSSKEWLELASEGSPDARELLAKIVEENQAEEQKDAQEKLRLAEHQRNKPGCDYVRFTGVASAAAPQLIQKVLASSDIEDTLARNPIRCDRMSCYGVAYLSNHPGRILNWSKEYLTVATPIDFDIGRRDIVLTIRREDSAREK